MNASEARKLTPSTQELIKKLRDEIDKRILANALTGKHCLDFSVPISVSKEIADKVKLSLNADDYCVHRFPTANKEHLSDWIINWNKP